MKGHFQQNGQTRDVLLGAFTQPWFWPSQVFTWRTGCNGTENWTASRREASTYQVIATLKRKATLLDGTEVPQDRKCRGEDCVSEQQPEGVIFHMGAWPMLF